MASELKPSLQVEEMTKFGDRRSSGDTYGPRAKQAGIEVFLPRALQKDVT